MPREVVLGVIGSSGVGKTCLVLQWLQGHYVESPAPTVESFYRLGYSVDGDTCVPLTVADTSGNEAFSVVRNRTLCGCNAFLFVYDVSDRASFDAVRPLYVRLCELMSQRTTFPTHRCFLLANKTDLIAARVVSSEEGQETAHALGCTFAEVSAKDSVATTAIFDTMMRLLLADDDSDSSACTEESVPAATSSSALSSELSSRGSQDRKKRKKNKCVMF